MDWLLSPVGQWIDRKVVELNFPYTAMFVGSWSNHDANMKVLVDKGLAFYWFGRTSNPYAQDFVPLYFVGATNAEQGAKCQEIFGEVENFCYVRYYKRHVAIKAIRKKYEQRPRSVTDAR